MLNQIKIAVILLLALVGCTEKETQVEVSSVSLNTATIEMVEGETFSLVATVLPKDAEYDGVMWASSNASVASVNSGTVTAVKEGTATITASAGGKSSTCTVKVSAKEVSVTSITLDKTSLSMQVGETETITATVSPDNATDKTVEWGSSDVAVATVADGIITARKSGETIITAKSGSCIAECKVTITVPTGSVTLDKTTLSLAIGESATLTATVKPDDATDKNVSWTSSDESIAKVDNGKVTAVKSGKATVTAKCGGKTADCEVTVTVPTGSVTLDKTTLSLAVGESATLTATVKPDDATDKNVSWTSSDESIAKVDNGKVTAVKSGKATVTAKCGGKTADCEVTVTVPTGSVTLDKTTLSLAVGESATLTATVKPDDATDKNVSWTSSDESIAKVDNGKVTAVKSGKATITATCGGKTAECAVTVTVPTGSVTLDKMTLSLAIGESAQLTATVKPDDATDKNVSWTSSDESVAKVDNGKVSAIKAGKATITAKCGGKTDECAVTVTVPVSSVILDKATLSLAVGETATLIATVRPDDATDKNIIWTSSDESIAKVERGKVIALGVGNVMITARIGMVSSTCNVTVIRSNNVIIYTSTDGNIVKPNNEDAFGAKILSNEYTYGLGLIKFDSPVTSIGRGAFYDCNSLSTVILPETVTMIGYQAFRRCKSMLHVNIPSNVTTIESDAFCECGVKHIVLPKSLSSLGEGAFRNSHLETINIPEGLSEIKKETFRYSNLKSIEIPSNIITIGEQAFAWSDSLTKVVLHEGLKKIYDYAFAGTGVKDIIIPNSLVFLDSGAFAGTNLENVIVPGGVFEIRYYTFSGCQKLKTAVISEGVRKIYSHSFKNCSQLESIRLPESLQVLDDPFQECQSISKVYIKAQNPPSQIRLYTLKNFVIYVPKASVALYKEKWPDYRDYIQGYDF